MEHGVRWNIKVSKEIDLTLRTYLGAQGMKKRRPLEIHRGGRPLAHLQSHRAGDQIGERRYRPTCGKFTLLTCAEHLDEVRATLQKPESPI
jgi:hypothetical protein